MTCCSNLHSSRTEVMWIVVMLSVSCAGYCADRCAVVGGRWHRCGARCFIVIVPCALWFIYTGRQTDVITHQSND